jgi:hypothetical protein
LGGVGADRGSAPDSGGPSAPPVARASAGVVAAGGPMVEVTFGQDCRVIEPAGRQVLLRDAGGLTPGTNVTNSGAAGRSSVWSPGGHGLSASPWMCSDIASIGSGDFGRPVR